MVHQFGYPVRAVPQVEEALEEAIRLAEGEAVVLVTGSIFVAVAVRDAWQARQWENTLELSGIDDEK
jgi:folylpolyglutamate synthase/dihydropteroate synthase